MTLMAQRAAPQDPPGRVGSQTKLAMRPSIRGVAFAFPGSM